jgi:hypothetical protein
VSHRSKLRRAANKANLPDKPYIVLDGLRLLLPDKDAHLVQVTWRQLQVQCNGMSNETLTRSLDHLERHGWITRTRIGGQGNPVRYELLIGKPCECRGRPTTSAERMRRMRDKRRKAASDVTLNGSKDLTASGSKHLADVTISGVTSRSSEAVFTCREPTSPKNSTDVPAESVAKDLLSESVENHPPPRAASVSAGSSASRPAAQTLTPRPQPRAASYEEDGGETGVQPPPGTTPVVTDPPGQTQPAPVMSVGSVADRNAQARKKRGHRRPIDVEVVRAIWHIT